MLASAISERRQWVKALCDEGIPATEQAKVLGLSERTVQRIRRDHLGLSDAPSFRPLTEDEKRRAEQLLDDGASFREVGKTLGRNESTISRHFPGRGWQPVQSGFYARFMERIERNATELVRELRA